MARTKNENVIDQTVVTDEDTPGLPALNTAADAQIRNNLVINQQFGLELYNRERVESEIRFFMGQSVDSLLNAGYRLIQIKENEPHGEWTDSLGRMKLDPDLANRLMTASIKFSNSATSRNLIESIRNKSQLFEFLVLDDEVIEELNNGGTVAGLHLDDVAKMPIKELRAALRKIRTDAKDTVDIKDKVIGQKDQTINKLTEEIEKLKAVKQANQEPEVFKPVGTDELEALQKLTLAINGKIGAELHIAIDRLYAAFGGLANTPRPMQLAAAQSVGLILTTCDSVAEFFYIKPETDIEHAAQDPAMADIKAFMEWDANGGADEITPEEEAFNQRMAVHQNARQPSGNDSVGEKFAGWEEQGGDAKQLFDFDE